MCYCKLKVACYTGRVRERERERESEREGGKEREKMTERVREMREMRVEWVCE